MNVKFTCDCSCGNVLEARRSNSETTYIGLIGPVGHTYSIVITDAQRRQLLDFLSLVESVPMTNASYAEDAGQ
jgi:hypothetical protein